MNPLFAFLGLGIPEMLVIGVIAVLLFGRKLPDMAKYLGKSVIEFKRGMHGLEDGINDVGGANSLPAPRPEAAPSEAIRPPQRVAATAPKFEDAPATPPQV